jgi:hypothetical protein
MHLVFDVISTRIEVGPTTSREFINQANLNSDKTGNGLWKLPELWKSTMRLRDFFMMIPTAL